MSVPAHLANEAQPKLRIACMGIVHEGAGSIASSNHLLLQALVDRGHSVEFMAAAGYLPDPGITGKGEFVHRTLALAQPPWVRKVAHLFGDRLRTLVGRWATGRSRRRVRDIVDAAPPGTYDVLLVLGVPAPTRISVPVVSWPQGLRGGELAVLRRRRSVIVAISGWRAYLPVRAYYELTTLLQRRRRGSWVIVASAASRLALVDAGHDPSKVVRVPYAIDFGRFRPQRRLQADVAGPRRVLCLGRLDPRKRIDLLVAATAILAARRSDFAVEVVGRPGYAPGWAELVDAASRTLPIAWRPAIPADEAADLLTRADVLVQPSEGEEFGHSVAEALASGVPVVVGPTNRTGEYVSPSVGTRFADYSPESIAAAIEHWLDAPRGAASAECRREAERAFAAAEVARAVEDVLCRAARWPQPPRSS